MSPDVAIHFNSHFHSCAPRSASRAHLFSWSGWSLKRIKESSSPCARCKMKTPRPPLRLIFPLKHPQSIHHWSMFHHLWSYNDWKWFATGFWRHEIAWLAAPARWRHDLTIPSQGIWWKLGWNRGFPSDAPPLGPNGSHKAAGPKHHLIDSPTAAWPNPNSGMAAVCHEWSLSLPLLWLLAIRCSTHLLWRCSVHLQVLNAPVSSEGRWLLQFHSWPKLHPSTRQTQALDEVWHFSCQPHPHPP